MADELKKVEKILESYPGLQVKETKEGKYRVLCELTSHEMPCTLEAVETYINGKKFKYYLENSLTSKEQELCTQYLIPKRRGQLYCTLTKKYINKLPHHIRLHLKGKRFQKVLESAGTSNSSLPNSSKCAEEITHGDGNAAMWVPSDSDSGSEKNEEIGSEIELDSCEGEKMDCSNEDYSFDILDTKKSLNEHPHQAHHVEKTESKPKKSENKKARKRTGKHLQEPMNKVEKKVKKKQEKKRKMIQ